MARRHEKRLHAAIGARKQPSVAQCDARPTGDDDGRKFEGAVKHDGEDGLRKESSHHKEGDECAHHDAIVEQIVASAETGKNPHDVNDERHQDVVDGDTQKTTYLRTHRVNRHGVSLRDIVERHVHIIIAEDEAGKFGVCQRRDGAHQATTKEEDKGDEQSVACLIDGKRNIVRPIPDNLRPRRVLVPVEVAVQSESEVVEIRGDG